MVSVLIVTVVFGVSKYVCDYTPVLNMSLDESEMQNPMDNEDTNNFLGYVPMLNRKVLCFSTLIVCVYLRMKVHIGIAYPPA